MSRQQKQICPKCALIGFREEALCSFCQGAKMRDDSEIASCEDCLGRFYKRIKSSNSLCIICKDKPLPIRVCICKRAFRSNKFSNCPNCRKKLRAEETKLKRESLGLKIKSSCKYCHVEFIRFSSKDVDKDRCNDCIRIQKRASKAPIEALRMRRSIFEQAKKAATSRRRLEWSITQEEWYSLIHRPCVYCNSLLKIKGGWIQLDRIDVKKGYHSSNVLPCCGDCNLIRGSRVSPTEMMEFMKGVLEYRLAKQDFDKMFK